ncbi:DMT family transporter [Helicobacter jaachi]|uniref:DMT family transporter n=1 Tax=Helicobacter jaachi TaxID=1677920 RepID=A0A4U8TBU8_9HELI|nr:DMT family transporter [Helicobacter jaachi]TLD97416.1 DMT family transporter [Helicobacter jaachi]
MKQQFTRGILAMLLSSFLFALMNAEAKILSTDMPSMEIAFFRAFLMVLILLPILIRKPFKMPYHKKGGWWILISRAMCGGLSFVALFYNIASISLGTASAFAQSMPLYVVVLSIIFLKERVRLSVIISTIVGFVGILLICNPSLNNLGIENIIFGIASALFMAIAFLNLRALKDYFSSWVAVFSTGVAMSLISLVASWCDVPFFDAPWVVPQGMQWLHVVLLGVFGTLAQQYLTKAYMIAPAGIVAPIDYTRLVFSVFLGVLLGDSLPNAPTSVGIMLIILSGIGVGLPVLLADIRRHKQMSHNNTKD